MRNDYQYVRGKVDAIFNRLQDSAEKFLEENIKLAKVNLQVAALICVPVASCAALRVA